MAWTKAGVLWTMLSCALIIAGALAYSTAVTRASVNSITAWTSTYPVFTFIVCVTMGEPVTVRKIVGILVAVGGVALVST